jgi:hypothetical protein
MIPEPLVLESCSAIVVYLVNENSREELRDPDSYKDIAHGFWGLLRYIRVKQVLKGQQLS